MESIQSKCDRLVELLRSFSSCAVAFSGGVDSAVVAKAAQLALGDRAVAVTGTSASLADGELDIARRVAAEIGIRHEVVETNEQASPDYRRNAGDRCYHCKTELYDTLDLRREQFNVAVVANGANLDDQGDHRPGMKAATEHAVRSPLAECGFDKNDVRAIAAHWGLTVWDKPAMPCLASRIAYGQEATPERMRQIDLAEQFLRSLDLRDVRVRYHAGDMARLEVPASEIARLASPAVRQKLVDRLRELGFKFVTLDLEGLRSGSLNQVLPAESLLATLKR